MTTGNKPRLLRNEQATGNHWIRFRLTSAPAGDQKPITSLSPIMMLWEPKSELKRRQVLRAVLLMPTRSYISQTELPVTFGLGTETEIQSVNIQWPSGKVTTLENLKADKLYQISEQDGLVDK